eukprot:15483235-Alexandrium_andersonii.AAC.1
MLLTFVPTTTAYLSISACELKAGAGMGPGGVCPTCSAISRRLASSSLILESGPSPPTCSALPPVAPTG